jgi:DNA-binding response OmpR family regulator
MRILIAPSPPPGPDLRQGLQAAGFVADGARDAAEARRKARSGRYDAVVLDLLPPRQEGWALLQRWRRAGAPASVLALAVRPDDAVRALDAGADGCLAFPFAVEELAARLRALIRRQRPTPPSPPLRVHDVEINPSDQTVRRAGRTIPLTPREFALLEFLALRPGCVLSRRTIRAGLYGDQAASRSNVIDVYIRYLRRKIDWGFALPLILTRRGQGYLLRGDDAGGQANAPSVRRPEPEA